MLWVIIAEDKFHIVIYIYIYKFNPYLTSALDEGEWSVSGSGHFRFGRETRYLI